MKIQKPHLVSRRSDLRQMTRSAPPERTLAKHSPRFAQHTSSSKAHAHKTSSDNGSVSVVDIYCIAEKERFQHSATSRRQNLAHAQSQTQFFCNERTPASGQSTLIDRCFNSFGREASTPFSVWSEPMLSRPNSLVPPPDLRQLEYFVHDNNLEMTHRAGSSVSPVSPISRDCCEIIGPQLCYECRKNKIRQMNMEMSEIYFPTLEPSESNLTTAAIIKKYLPGLSDVEIEDKLARGEIARPLFKKHSKRLEFSDEEDEEKPGLTNKKVTFVEHSKANRERFISQRKASNLFFTNIKDLNNRIVTGNVDRKIGFSNVVRSVQTANNVTSLTGNYYPTFVSPRKVKMVQETKYKTYYEPPLIEKEKQEVEPVFFAGSNHEYILPEKLPDELVFVDESGKEVKASSSKSFTAKLSASSEGGMDTKHFETDTFKSKCNRRESLLVSNLIEEEAEEEEEEDENKG